MKCVACRAPDPTTRHADYLGLCAICRQFIERLVAMPDVQRALREVAAAGGKEMVR
jgi:hypothetical protein